jgi:hypothetical protein
MANLPGAFMEAGAYRGGTGLIACFGLDAAGLSDREVILADSFAGFEPLSEGKTAAALDQIFADEDIHETNDAGGADDVVDFLVGNGLGVRRYSPRTNRTVWVTPGNAAEPRTRVTVLEGYFSETLRAVPDLAVLRIDCDTFGCTLQALCGGYDSLAIDGFLVVDDWSYYPQSALASKWFLKYHSLFEETQPRMGFIRFPWLNPETPMCFLGACNPPSHAEVPVNFGGVYWRKAGTSATRDSALCIQAFDDPYAMLQDALGDDTMAINGL